MTYPGNNSLAADIRERLLTTFDQTLDLAEKGARSEALTGCDFVLRLDPLFDPARQLKERLESGDTAIEVGDLRVESEPETKAEPAAAAEDVFDLSSTEQDDTGAQASAESSASEAPTPSQEADVFSELESALDFSALESADESESAEEPVSEPEQAAKEATDYSATPDAGEPQPEAAAGEPSAALDAESEARIAELLTEGQTAFESTEYQSAIDAWSRIFLIDIDHAEASRRIELARKLKAEVERQVEEVFHEALQQIDTGDFEAARAGFQHIVEIQPSHLAAQEYLEKLASGGFSKREQPQPTAVEAPDAKSVAAPAGAPDHSVLEDMDTLGVDLEGVAELSDSGPRLSEIEEQKDPIPMPKPERRPRKGLRLRPSILYLGGAVLVLVLGGLWFLWNNWDSTFPNAGEETAAPTRRQIDPIARATKVFEEGNTALALAQLKRLSPSHERYAEAQALIAQWEAPVEEEKPQTPSITPEQITERDRLLRDGRLAYDNIEYLRAYELLTLASNTTALNEDDAALLTRAVEELRPLESEIAIFRQGEWAEALRSLWRIRQSGVNTPDLERLMVDSYFNLGVRDLQRQEPLAAAENFREALDLTDSDVEIERLIRFARTYETRQVDLLYKIFVKYLPFR